MSKQQFMYHNIQIKNIKLDNEKSKWIHGILQNTLKDLFCIINESTDNTFSILSKDGKFHTKILDSIYSPMKSLIKIKDEDLFKYMEAIYDRRYGETLIGSVRDEDRLLAITKLYFDAFREQYLSNDLFAILGSAISEGIITNDKIKVIIYLSTEFDDSKKKRKVDRFVFTITNGRVERTLTSFTVPKNKDLNIVLK